MAADPALRLPAGPPAAGQQTLRRLRSRGRLRGVAALLGPAFRGLGRLRRPG